MKKFLLGSLALAAMLATPAMAADMPAKAKAPPPPPPVYDWSGVYIGFSVGYNWQDFDWRFNPPLANAPNQAFSLDTDNWIVDGHAGAQIQWGWLVAGVEASYSVTTPSRWAQHFGYGVGNAFAQAKIHELATAGGRLGIAWDRVLIYGAGGYAAGLVETRNVGLNGVENLGLHTNTWHDGWYAGGGIDWMIHKGPLVDVILGVEYRHVDLGTDFHCSATRCGLVNTNNHDIDARMDIVHARLTIKTQGWGIFWAPPPPPPPPPPPRVSK